MLYYLFIKRKIGPMLLVGTDSFLLFSKAPDLLRRSLKRIIIDSILARGVSQLLLLKIIGSIDLLGLKIAWIATKVFRALKPIGLVWVSRPS